ncbi:T9SS type A sorting domain-containing protein [Aureisphaera galaxeae]|uniref:T9SS type A sorting domain-containing protein n=1 Tax=Aureisphaera galaxeae TaxID=1538023 RepID=UPI002350DC20|nr:T9SS type A sorting domain-containing protein [Aureisphaera galaxeae]MDC8003226.1 T9SS type A sorting domain-containing protein [Aureisphaera galaxeae]
MKKPIMLLWLWCIPLMVCAQDIAVFASDRGNNAVNKYDVDGNFLEVFIDANSGGLSNPQDIVFHPDGSVLISGFLNNAILQYDGETGDYMGEFSSGYSIQGATRMEYREDEGLIYVLQWNSNFKTVRFDLNGNFVDEFTSIGIFQSIGIDWDTSNNLYISTWANGTNGSVTMFDTNGDPISIFGDTAILVGPTNIWFTDENELWALDYSANRVSRFDASGTFIDHIITGIANPEGYDYLPNGNLLIAERGGNKISEFTSGGTPLGQWDNGGTLNTPNFVRVRVPSLSIAENERQAQIMVPTMGTVFEISSRLAANFESLLVYSISGALVEEIDLAQTLLWDASHLASGLYFIRTTGTNGTSLTQKLLVN